MSPDATAGGGLGAVCSDAPLGLRRGSALPHPLSGLRARGGLFLCRAGLSVPGGRGCRGQVPRGRQEGANLDQHVFSDPRPHPTHHLRPVWTVPSLGAHDLLAGRALGQAPGGRGGQGSKALGGHVCLQEPRSGRQNCSYQTQACALVRPGRWVAGGQPRRGQAS